MVLEQENYVVYALIDPRTDEIRYVGMSRCLEQRFRKHCHAQTHGNLKIWEYRLQEKGLEPELRILESNVPLEEIDQRERFWIAEGDREGWPLLNVSSGGSGWGWREMPKSVRLKISKSMKRNWADPDFREEQIRRTREAVAAPDVRANLSRLAFEREPMSDETRTKISQTVSELWEDPEYREKQVQAHLESSHIQWQDKDFRDAHKEAMNKPETKAKISQKAKEMWADSEIRAKLVAERKSRGKLSDEHRAKIAAGVKRNWKKRRQRKSKLNNGG